MTTLVVVAGLVSTPAIADAQDFDQAARLELVYTGEFIDQGHEPITGIFPLVFKLYATEGSPKALWQESHFISVVDGSYSIALGREKSLPSDTAGKMVFLAVELDDKEMVRQPLTPRVVSEEVREGPSGAVGSTGLSASAFAEQAGDAETVGGFKPEEFAPASLIEKVDKHLRDKSLHGGGEGDAAAGAGGGALGSQTWKSDRAGGTGGSAYTLACPEGYVMTGLEGRSGAVVDSMRILCTKLD